MLKHVRQMAAGSHKTATQKHIRHNTNVRGSPQPWGYVHQTIVSFIIHQIPDLQNATSLLPYILLIGSLSESTSTGD